MNDFNKDIQKALSVYTADIQKGMKAVAKQNAKDLRKSLKSSSPRRSGEYAKEWAIKNTMNSYYAYEDTVHNKKHYRLTHLLENGHIHFRTRRKVKPEKHIAKAFEKVYKKYIKDIENLITKG